MQQRKDLIACNAQRQQRQQGIAAGGECRMLASVSSCEHRMSCVGHHCRSGFMTAHVPPVCAANPPFPPLRCGIDEETAARIAREIMQGDTSNPHMAEERGQAVDDSGVRDWLGARQGLASMQQDSRQGSRSRCIPSLHVARLNSQYYMHTQVECWASLLPLFCHTCVCPHS